MGRIKSTLELALERAAAMSEAAEDVEDYQRREIDAGADTVVTRFMEDELFGPERLLQFVSRYHGHGRDQARKSVCARLLAAVHADTWQRALEGMTAFCPALHARRPPPLAEALEALQAEADALLEQHISARIVLEEDRRRRELDQAGIRGSAVVVTPSPGDVRQAALLEVERAMGEKWEAIRRRVSQAMDAGEGRHS